MSSGEWSKAKRQATCSSPVIRYGVSLPAADQAASVNAHHTSQALFLRAFTFHPLPWRWCIWNYVACTNPAHRYSGHGEHGIFVRATSARQRWLSATPLRCCWFELGEQLANLSIATFAGRTWRVASRGRVASRTMRLWETLYGEHLQSAAAESQGYARPYAAARSGLG